jgi:hypothetical protein
MYQWECCGVNVSMHFGVNGYVAHASSQRQDIRQEEKDTKTKVTGLKRDIKSMKATLVDVVASNNKCEEARKEETSRVLLL